MLLNFAEVDTTIRFFHHSSKDDSLVKHDLALASLKLQTDALRF